MSDADSVKSFVERYRAHDFDGVGDCLSDETFERSGPYLDVIRSKTEYVAFLKRVVPTLGPRYELAPVRITHADDGTTAFAELIKELQTDGSSRNQFLTVCGPGGEREVIEPKCGDG